MTDTKLIGFRATPEMELMLEQLRKRTGCKDTSETIRTVIRAYALQAPVKVSAFGCKVFGTPEMEKEG